MDQDIKIMAEPKDAETCRFKVDRPVFPRRSYYFGSEEKAEASPLAKRLFEIEGVRAVLVHHNTVTVSTWGTADWPPVAKQIGAAIRDALSSPDVPIPESLLAGLPSESEIRDKVQKLLDHEINPAVASHGGRVQLIGVKGNEVYLQLGGGCQGCGMVDVTLKHGIEKAIREAVPEVGAILDETDHASGTNPYYEAAR
jgi:Fe-S cluster biogenesis protein NfuA